MPYANNGGVRIYYEAEGVGPPLLLHHGWTGYGGSWRMMGQVDTFVPHCRVIVMDARGHGRSDKPHEGAAYTMDKRAADVCAVLDAEGIDAVNYYGYSMGGRTGFGLARYRQDRLQTLIIGGASPRSPLRYDQEQMRRLIVSLRTNGLRDLLALFSDRSEVFKKRFMLNDAEALAAEREGLLMWDGMDPSTITVPTLIFVGEADGVLGPAQDAAAKIPNVEFHVLPDLNHMQANMSPEGPRLALDFLRKHGILPK